MKYYISILIIFFGYHSFAQDFSYNAEVNLVGIASTESSNPFWFYSNKRGRADAETNFSGWANSTWQYSLNDKSSLSAGLGVLYYDGRNDEVKLDESFLQYNNTWLEIVAGRKQQAVYYNGLSATNENILWSLNARPLPGIQLRTSRPITVFKDEGIAFEAELEEFWLGNNRIVEGAKLHHKSFHVTINPVESFNLRFGIQHFAQWGGTSPEYGKLPNGLGDYFRIFFGNEGASDATEGGQENALGNHLGSYEASFGTQVNGHQLTFIYNHLFEDGSGRRFRNTPDGRYGVFFENKNMEKSINSFMYEFYYTRNQSKGSSTTDGGDNYFQHQIYGSGWTYDGHVLGVPFILLGNEGEDPSMIQNKVMVHHLGIGGNLFNNNPFKLLLSYRKNYGTKGITNYKFDVLSSYLDLQLYNKWIECNLFVGSDIFTDRSPVFGAGIHLKKDIF